MSATKPQRPPQAQIESDAQPILACKDVEKRFDGVHALRGASLTVPVNGVHALIGPNGAGKTTLFNCITGLIGTDGGSIQFKGESIHSLPPHKIARLGIARTFQNIRTIENFTVLESVLFGQYVRSSQRPTHRWWRSEWIRQSSVGLDDVKNILNSLGLTEVSGKRCSDLTLLLQRKVEIARALASNPDLLLLDEPSAGATRPERQELSAAIDTLRERNITILLIEHDVPFVTGVSDTVTVLDFGKTIASGTPAEIRSNSEVQRIYMGM